MIEKNDIMNAGPMFGVLGFDLYAIMYAAINKAMLNKARGEVGDKDAVFAVGTRLELNADIVMHKTKAEMHWRSEPKAINRFELKRDSFGECAFEDIDLG